MIIQRKIQKRNCDSGETGYQNLRYLVLKKKKRYPSVFQSLIPGSNRSKRRLSFKQLISKIYLISILKLQKQAQIALVSIVCGSNCVGRYYLHSTTFVPESSKQNTCSTSGVFFFWFFIFIYFYFYVFSSFNILNAFPPIIFKIILDYIAKILVNLFIVNFQKLIFPKIILLLLFSNFQDMSIIPQITL